MGVPPRHVVGLGDALVPTDYIRQYIAIDGEHAAVRLDINSEVGRYELIVPDSAAWPKARRAVPVFPEE